MNVWSTNQPMRQWVLSVPFPLRFLFASYPDIMGKVLRLVYRTIATHLIRKAGFIHKTARTGAVTFIQRFGSALNLNVHFHILFLDGVYTDSPHGKTRFQQVNAPTSTELQSLLHTISQRIGKLLTRQGLLTQDDENSYLTLEDNTEGEEHTMQQLRGHSITYRVAKGARYLPCKPCPQILRLVSIVRLVKW